MKEEASRYSGHATVAEDKSPIVLTFPPLTRTMRVIKMQKIQGRGKFIRATRWKQRRRYKTGTTLRNEKAHSSRALIGAVGHKSVVNSTIKKSNIKISFPKT